MVDEFVEGMRALTRKAILQSVARYLEVDATAEVDAIHISAPGTSIESRPKRAAPPAVKKPPASPPARAKRSAPARRATPARAAAEPKATRAAPVEAGAGAHGTPETEAESEQASPTSWLEETAATLLSHVEIEPGQGLEELALAMGTSAADLEQPIKKLLAENRILEELHQGQATYYPV